MKEFLADSKNEVTDDGIEDAFQMKTQAADSVVSGIWLKTCFFYLTNQNKLNYLVTDKPLNYAFLERSCSILGYMPTQGVLFLVDGANKILSFEVPVQFPAAISHIQEAQFDELAADLEKIENHKFHDKIAKYLEAEDNLEQAFQIVKNPEVKLDYALKLEYIDEAHEIARKSGSKSALKQIGDLCLQKGLFQKAEDAFRLADDYPSLFLLYSSLGRPDSPRRPCRHRLAERRVPGKARLHHRLQLLLLDETSRPLRRHADTDQELPRSSLLRQVLLPLAHQQDRADVERLARQVAPDHL